MSSPSDFALVVDDAQWQEALSHAREQHAERPLVAVTSEGEAAIASSAASSTSPYARLLSGYPDNLPNLLDCVRVFTSSTFTDTSAERNFLIDRVYPALLAQCRAAGVSFHAVDLRWGIRDEATDDHRTADICMSEIDKCTRQSIGPIFVHFSTNKYGWRCPPARVPVTELESLLQLCGPSARDTVLRCYKRDDNQVPAQYMLLPLSVIVPAYASKDAAVARAGGAEWWELQCGMLAILRDAVERSTLPESQRWKWVVSITEQEVLRATLFNSSPELRARSFCFRRTIEGLGLTDPAARLYVDKAAAGLDTEAQKLLHLLRDTRLPLSFPAENLYDYTVSWHPDGITFATHRTHVLKYCADVQVALERSVAAALTLRGEASQAITSCVREAVKHLLFAVGKAASFVGRAELLGSIDGFVRALLHTGEGGEALVSPARVPVVVVGESGSGKTALMATAFLKCRASLPSAACLVCRFVGASPLSCSALSLLRSIVQQIASVYDCSGINCGVVPEEYKDLCALVRVYLSVATAEAPIVLFIDSLDQLDNSDGGREELQWLPDTLPPNVAVVLSTLHNVGGCWLALERKGFVGPCPIPTSASTFTAATLLPSTAAGPEVTPSPEFPSPATRTSTAPVACAAPVPQPNVVCVLALAPQECSSILRAWLLRDARSLSAAQLQAVESAVARCPLPLYIKLAYDRTLHWRSYHPAEDFEPSIEGLVHRFYSDLERYYGKCLVSTAMGLLCASSGGLSEPELVDLLSCDECVLDEALQYHSPPRRRLPPLVWVRLRDACGEYLVERGVGGGGGVVIGLYHRKFWEVAQSRYLAAAPEDTPDFGLVTPLKANPLAALVKLAVRTLGPGRRGGGGVGGGSVGAVAAVSNLQHYCALLAAYFSERSHSVYKDRGLCPQPLWFCSSSVAASAAVAFVAGAGAGAGAAAGAGAGPVTALVNVRRVTQLPRALIASSAWEQLVHTLCDWHFLQAKCTAGQVYELLQDFSDALAALSLAASTTTPAAAAPTAVPATAGSAVNVTSMVHTLDDSAVATPPLSHHQLAAWIQRVVCAFEFLRAHACVLFRRPHLLLQQAVNTPALSLLHTLLPVYTDMCDHSGAVALQDGDDAEYVMVHAVGDAGPPLSEAIANPSASAAASTASVPAPVPVAAPAPVPRPTIRPTGTLPAGTDSASGAFGMHCPTRTLVPVPPQALPRLLAVRTNTPAEPDPCVMTVTGHNDWVTGVDVCWADGGAGVVADADLGVGDDTPGTGTASGAVARPLVASAVSMSSAVSSSLDGCVKVWALGTGACVGTARVLAGAVNCVRMCAPAASIDRLNTRGGIVGSGDAVGDEVDASSTGRGAAVSIGPGAGVSACGAAGAVVPPPARFIVGCSDGSLQCWDLRMLTRVWVRTGAHPPTAAPTSWATGLGSAGLGLKDEVTGLSCVAAAGGVVLAGGQDGGVSVCDGASGEGLWACARAHTGVVSAVVLLSLHPLVFLSAGRDGCVLLHAPALPTSGGCGSDTPHRPPTTIVQVEGTGFTSMALSPQSPTQPCLLAVGSQDKRVRMYSLDSFDTTRAVAAAGLPGSTPDAGVTEAAVGAAAGVSDGDAADAATPTAMATALETLPLIGEVVVDAGVYACAFTSSRTLAVGTDTGTVVAVLSVDARHVQHTLSLKGHSYGVTGVVGLGAGAGVCAGAGAGAAVAASGQLLTCSRDSRLKQWDWSIPSENPVDAPAPGHSTCITHALALSKRSVLTACADGSVGVWEAGEAKGPITFGRVGSLLPPGGACVYALALEPCVAGASAEARVATCTWGDGTNSMRVWGSVSHSLLHTFTDHTNSVVWCAFSPLGTYLASCSMDFSAVVYRAADYSVACVLKGHEGGVRAISFSPDERLAVTCSQDASLRVWDVHTGALVRVLQGHRAWVRCCAWSPDGTTIVSVGGDRTVMVWRLSEAASPAAPVPASSRASASASTDPSHPATASPFAGPFSHTVMRTHTHICWQVCFSPSGARFATVSEDGTAVVHDTATLAELACFAPRTGMRAVCMCDDDTLVCGGGDGTLFSLELVQP